MVGMIPLTLSAQSEADRPFVARVGFNGDIGSGDDAKLISEVDGEAGFAGRHGFFSVSGNAADINGDVLLIDPDRGTAERVLRAGSKHNTLLVTERCDQLCVMCSQPPKKTHVDRFGYFKQACLLAEPDALIGISGGEPTLYKNDLLSLLEHVLVARPDLGFHVLSNGQHFDRSDIDRLRNPIYRRVIWGIPLYSAEPKLHDHIVGKQGAFAQLEQSLLSLLLAGARIELRTVVMLSTVPGLAGLADHIASRLSFIESWSIMQLENIGFARNRWAELHFDHSLDFSPIARAIDRAALHAMDVQLFNFPLCTVPPAYRRLAPASISDWKRKYAEPCRGCSAQQDCTGFFEWHPETGLMERISPL
jgi:His-Xaa-Ser system radical SAM maturase HxsC